MRAQYKTANGRILFEVQQENVKAVFAEIAQIQEVFDAERSCGLCQSEDLRFVHRSVDDFHYFELKCGKCFAHFQFGQSKKGGGLFPKRKDDTGKPLPNGGWTKYQPKSNIGD